MTINFIYIYTRLLWWVGLCGTILQSDSSVLNSSGLSGAVAGGVVGVPLPRILSDLLRPVIDVEIMELNILNYK